MVPNSRESSASAATSYGKHLPSISPNCNDETLYSLNTMRAITNFQLFLLKAVINSFLLHTQHARLVADHNRIFTFNDLTDNTTYENIPLKYTPRKMVGWHDQGVFYVIESVDNPLNKRS